MLLNVFLLSALAAILLGALLSMKRRHFRALRCVKRWILRAGAVLRDRLRQPNRKGVWLSCLTVLLLAVYFTLAAQQRGAALAWPVYFLLCLLAMAAAYALLGLGLQRYVCLLRNCLGDTPVGVRRMVSLLVLVILVLLLQPELTKLQTVVLLACTGLLYLCNFANVVRLLRYAWNGRLTVRQLWGGLIAVLLAFFLVFSTAFYGYQLLHPDAFTQPLTLLDAMYFTTITFVTIGFGDIAPVLPFVKLCAILCAATSVICLIFLVGAVMSLTPRARKPEAKSEAARTRARLAPHAHTRAAARTHLHPRSDTREEIHGD